MPEPAASKGPVVSSSVSLVDKLVATPVVALYRFLCWALTPLIHRYLQRRIGRGKEEESRLGERLGAASLPRPAGPLAWIHAASVGESLSVLPLIERLRQERPALSILMTSGTVTSARLMAERLPEGVKHQYVPVDLPQAVRRFFDHWRPDVVFFVESEFWPNLLLGCRHRGIPLVLLNGRMSADSYRSWRRVKPLIRYVLSSFRLSLTQSPEDGDRFAALGAPGVASVGNLKQAAFPLPVKEAVLEDHRKLLDGRPRWLAASTHPGEEALAAEVHNRLAAAHPGLITLIVPRHPERGPEIAAALAESGESTALRSAGETISAATSLYIADTLGELGLWYRLSELVFMGGSLAGKGGQNPLEPARLDCAILHGPDMSNFSRISAELTAAGGCLAVESHQHLAETLDRLLTTPDERHGLAAAAHRYAEAEAGVLERFLEMIAPLLDPIAPAPPPPRSPDKDALSQAEPSDTP